MDQHKIIRGEIVQARHSSTSQSIKALVEFIAENLRAKGHVIPKIRIERLIRATRGFV